MIRQQVCSLGESQGGSPAIGHRIVVSRWWSIRNATKLIGWRGSICGADGRAGTSIIAIATNTTTKLRTCDLQQGARTLRTREAGAMVQRASIGTSGPVVGVLSSR